MKIALVKIAPSGDRLIPLNLACLQAYLKEHGIDVDVFDVRGNYDLEKIMENPFSQIYSARLIPTHHEIPLILPIIDAIQEGREIDLSEGIFPDLLTDRAIRLYDTPAKTMARYKAKLRFTKSYAKKLSGKYNLIGFTMNYLNSAETAFTSAFLKQNDPSIQILWGGPNVTQTLDLPKLFIQRKITDGVVIGEGEAVLLDAALGSPISEISGIMTYPEGKSHYLTREPLNLDILPTPDWTGIALDPYYRGISLYSSRGCPNRCSFCAEWGLFGPAFRQRSATKVAEDLLIITQKFHPEYVIFGDSAVNAKSDYFSHLCDLLINQGNTIPIAAHFRADITPEVAFKARRAGFDDAWIGIEALTDNTLIEMHKGLGVKQNLNAIRVFNQAGIHVIAMLVVGASSSSEEIANYHAVLGIIKQLSQERIEESSGKKNRFSVAFRPAPWYLLPGSLDYKQTAKQITIPWRPLVKSAENIIELDNLSKILSEIPYEFIRKTPDEIIFSIIHGIQEANLDAKFLVGGSNIHILNYMKRLSPENLEETLKNMGPPGAEILDYLKTKNL